MVSARARTLGKVFVMGEGDVFTGRHDREGRRLALQAAAMQIFAREGYEQATTRQIAEQAGCAEGLIHRYFGGKRGLLMSIMRDKAAELVKQLPALREHRLDLAEDLQIMLGKMIDTMGERADYMRVGVAQAMVDPEVGQVLAVINAAPLEALRQLFRDHQAAGRVGTDVDIDAAASLFHGLAFHYGFLVQTVLGAGAEAAKQQAAAAISIIARGLAPAPCTAEE